MVLIVGGVNLVKVYFFINKLIWVFYVEDDFIIFVVYLRNIISVIKKSGGYLLYMEYFKELEYDYVLWVFVY